MAGHSNPLAKLSAEGQSRKRKGTGKTLGKDNPFKHNK